MKRGEPVAPPARRTDTLPIAVLLTMIVAIAPLSIDTFLPSMPSMAVLFGTDAATMQLGVTLFIACFAASQLVYGSLSDRYGRRPVLMAGLGLFTVGGLMCLAASGVRLLLAGRVLQGLAAGSGPAVGRAVVRDIYGPERAAKVLSYMAVAQSMAPMLAPVLGGFLQEAFGWRSVFVTLSALGATFLVSTLVAVPETNAHLDPAALQPRHLVANYRTLLRDRTFLAYALVICLMFCGHFIFISSSAFVLIGVFGLSPRAFGFAFGFTAFGLMSGAFISGRLSGRLGLNRLVVGGAALGAVAALAMAGWSWAGGGVWGILGTMFLFAVGSGLARPNATAGALIPWPRMAGLASALLGFIQMAGAAAYAIAFGTVSDGSPGMMAGAIALAAVAALGALLLLPQAAPGQG